MRGHVALRFIHNLSVVLHAGAQKPLVDFRFLEHQHLALLVVGDGIVIDPPYTVDGFGCDGRYRPRSLTVISSGVSSVGIGATFTLSSFWSMLSSSSAIRPTRPGTISKVYSFISGRLFTKVGAFTDIIKADLSFSLCFQFKDNEYICKLLRDYLM